MTLRRERRRIARKKARHRAMKQSISSYTTINAILGHRKSRARLHARQGSIRHQPRSVRELLKGKRHYCTREEQEKINFVVDTIIKATWILALGADYDETMNSVKERFEKIGIKREGS